jgi:hypothetical protein
MSSAQVANHTSAASSAAGNDHGKNDRAMMSASNEEESTVLYGTKEAKHALHARISKSKLGDGSYPLLIENLRFMLWI